MPGASIVSAFFNKRWPWIACLVAALATQTAFAGERRALLIGINDYQAVPSLQGSLNDVEAMQEILVSRWHFDRRNITVLLDRAATRAGILGALDQLVRTAAADDLVYVHYSGHGSQVEDENGDEKDGLDETLVPQDGRTKGVPDITDDELDRVFSRMKTRNVVVVLDSCHSGTATRALDIRARSVPRDTRVELYRGGTQTRAIVPTISSRFVLMSAAAANEEALDGPVEGRYHGFFTYALARSAATRAATASPRDLFDGVAGELNRIKSRFGRAAMPEPQLEAPPALFDQPLFAAPGVSGGPSDARVAWVAAELLTSGEVRLARGAVVGATPGTKWVLYGADEMAFAPGRGLANVDVVRIDGADAIARPDATARAVPARARAILLLPSPNAARVPIRIVGVPNNARPAIEAALSRDIRNVSFVGANEPARFMVDMQNDQMRLMTADGLQVVGLYGTSSPGWAASMSQQVNRLDTAAELLTLDNPTSALRLSARLANDPMRGTRGVTVVADTQPAGYRIRRSNEPRSVANSLQLELFVNADAYLTVVDVDSEGNVNLLFPNSFHQQRGLWVDGRVSAGESVRLPDALTPGNRAGFYWDYSPPRGVDTIRVFAATTLAAAQAIRARIAAASAARQNGIAPVIQGLRADLAGFATRGVQVVGDNAPSAAGADWTAVTLTAVVSD
jgi:uncharacterized caspase-like protein